MLPAITCGTSGFRGLTFVELLPGHALAVGTLYAQLRQEQARASGRDHARLVVAHDQRHGARPFATLVMAGMQSTGAEVFDLGLSSTPVALNWMTAQSPIDGAILVTGSHMGPDRIGLIPINSDGTYCRKDLTVPLQEAVPEFFGGRPPLATLDRILPVQRVDPTARDAFYLERALSTLNRAAIYAEGFRVLLDPGNGTAAPVARLLLESLGCQVTVINEAPKPIPNRPSEVRAKTCGQAMRLTAAERFTLGACFDGDADRVLFITTEGVALSEDVVAGIFAKNVLQKGDTCVATLNSSGLMAALCREAGAQLVECCIGQPDTGRAVLAHHARFASEPAAKYWFGDHWNWYDGPYAVARMLQIMRERGMSLAELAAELPHYHQASANFAFSPATTPDLYVRAIITLREELGAEIAAEDTRDGTKFTLTDGSWLLVRPSGTEPLLRVYTDSPDEARANALLAVADKTIRILAT